LSRKAFHRRLLTNIFRGFFGFIRTQKFINFEFKLIAPDNQRNFIK